MFENAFTLLIFGFLSIVNNVMLIFFWAYAGIPGVDGLSPLGSEGEEVSFDISAGMGYFNSILFFLLMICELILIKPAYNKLCWNTFQQIGSDVHIQTCYQNYEVAKGSWIMLMWFSFVEFSTVLFFEDEMAPLITFSILFIAYFIGLGMGFKAVREYKLNV